MQTPRTRKRERGEVQFEWIGEENSEDVWSYACSLGPKDTFEFSLNSHHHHHQQQHQQQQQKILPLQEEDVHSLVVVHQAMFPSVLVPEVEERERKKGEEVLKRLKDRIDYLLHGEVRRGCGGCGGGGCGGGGEGEGEVWKCWGE